MTTSRHVPDGAARGHARKRNYLYTHEQVNSPEGAGGPTTSKRNLQTPTGSARRQIESQEEKRMHETVHANTSHDSSPRGALWCLLAGGLTNQENEVGNCLLLASALGRRLIMPRPVVALGGACGDPWCHLDAGAAPPPAGARHAFGKLWDVSRFHECAARTYQVTLLSDSAAEHAALTTSWMQANLTWARGDPNINWTFTRFRHRGGSSSTSGSQHNVHTLSVSKPHAGQQLPELRADVARDTLRRHVPRSVGLVIVPEPFFALSSRFDPAATCCEPTQRIIARANAVRATLPQRFACLHARLELDWFSYCCSLLELPTDAATLEGERERRRTLSRPRASFTTWARHGGRGNPPSCSASHPPPPRSCYVGAERIVETMRKDARLPPRSVVYVASGVSHSLLTAIAESFDVRWQHPSGGEGTSKGPEHSPSYEDALVDREVCRHARLPLFAHSRSTFSTVLGRLRETHEGGALATVWYDGQ